MKTTLFAAAVSVAVAANATEANKPLRLHYDRPAEFFEETLVIGNGNIGAILYGGVGKIVCR